jgi:L-alanine-DL-glutamate epimerase-like enolase superfamily enzyme
MLEIPNLPGLGVEIDQDKLDLYTPDAALFFKK